MTMMPSMMEGLVNRRVASMRGGAGNTFMDLIELADRIPGVIALGRGEPDIPTPAHIAEAAREAIRRGDTGYTHPGGILPLRQAIADKLQTENGLTYDPETEILVCAGAQEAMAVIFQTLLDPGDEVLLATPHYLAYEENIIIAGGVPVLVPTYEEHDYEEQPEDIERLITDRTKLIVLITPSNPTAAVIRPETLARIAEIAKRRNLLVLSDELYEKVVYDGFEPVSIATLPGMWERTIVVNGFSKAYSMTGFRVGYLAAPADFCRDASKVRHAFSISTSTPSQHAAIAALTGPQDHLVSMMATYHQRRDRMRQTFDQLGIRYGLPRGGFYFFVNIQGIGMSSYAFCEKAVKEAKLLFFPGTMFGAIGEGFVRISFLADEPDLEEALARFEALWKATVAH